MEKLTTRSKDHKLILTKGTSAYDAAVFCSCGVWILENREYIAPLGESHYSYSGSQIIDCPRMCINLRPYRSNKKLNSSHKCVINTPIELRPHWLTHLFKSISIMAGDYGDYQS